MRQIAAFYADPHFGHSNILKYCVRPFGTVDEMNGELIDRYNNVIEDDDTVLWLGDCFFHGTYDGILEELNGTKILIIGNHDRSMAAMAKLGFALVLQEAVIDIGGVTCRVNHYPYKPEPTFEKPDKFATCALGSNQERFSFMGIATEKPRFTTIKSMLV